MEILNRIKNHIEIETGIDIMQDTRRINVNDMRAVYYYIAMMHTKYTYEQVGAFVNRTHATVIHHFKSFDDFKFKNKYVYNLGKNFKKEYLYNSGSDDFNILSKFNELNKKDKLIVNDILNVLIKNKDYKLNK